MSFIFACAWGIGGTLSEDLNTKFDSNIKKKFPNIEFEADSITNCYLNMKKL